MARKHSRLTLYETIRRRKAPDTPQPQEPATPVPPAPPAHAGPSLIERLGAWLKPGRSLRVPIGYGLLSAAIILVVVCSVYMWGHSRGYQLARAEAEETFLNRGYEPANDPLLSLEARNEPSRPATTTNVFRSPGVMAAATDEIQKPKSSASWGPVVPDNDPRQRGLNYFVLAETYSAGAKRLAEFCRSHGLETYVVAGKNNRLRRVIAFPGFQSTARTSKEIRDLEATIHRIGDKWKNEERGITNLRDAYPSLYGG